MNGHNPPTSCCHCGDPFQIEGNHMRAWRGSDGHLYCSSDCEISAANGGSDDQNVH